MTDRVTVGNLRVAQVLHDFINNEALPGTDIDPDSFWAGVDGRCSRRWCQTEMRGLGTA
jgi:malate synthase